MFADDTAIITQNKRFSVVISNLQHYISLFELWLTDWKVKVNASKSACLMFTSRPRLPVGLTPVQIFGQPVPWIKCIFESENILVPEQHGFRPRLSTSHQLLRVVEYIKDAIDRNQHVAAVFLDIQKAFDRVWHTGLLFKLITYKIPPPLILLLKSYISERSFTVRINRTFSQTRPAKAGIAQGSILGPVLFNLYVNDIIKTTNTMICMYADDTAILSRHYNPNTLTQNINEHLAHLEIWFSVWKIAINTSKTEVSFVQGRRSRCDGEMFSQEEEHHIVLHDWPKQGDHKLSPIFKGPFVIVRPVGAVCYEIKSRILQNKFIKVVHVQHLRPYFKRDADVIQNNTSDEENDSSAENQDPAEDHQEVSVTTEPSSSRNHLHRNRRPPKRFEQYVS
ncbi:RNA-directed DNA polymerase from mobile element jockey [Trichonephila clavipes]|nr:RNA-directed DNA polymerase from mobile element jockey [Trichonephila clavipes]